MLDLDSPRWQDLPPAGGNARLVPELIRSLKEHPTAEAWAEVWEQVAHQWTLYPVAYAATPHLLRLGMQLGIASRPDFLLNLGRVAAPFERRLPIPDDLESDFSAALATAAKIATSAAAEAEGSYAPSEYVYVLYAAAALSGRVRLAHGWISVAMAGLPDEAELECPACDAYMLGALSAEGIKLQAVAEGTLNPVSEQSKAPPRDDPGAVWDRDNPPRDDLAWTVALCRAAGQGEVLFALRCLFAEGRCPVCGASFVVMQAVERSHAPNQV